MISLDQVYLLEQKVESAVEKIQQLQAENDALRNKCDELTNALSAKSEQLSNFESDQSQIENGIKKALDRLNSIENSVLKTAGQSIQTAQTAKPLVQTTAAATQQASVQNTTIPQTQNIQNSSPSFSTMDTVSKTEVENEIKKEEAQNIPEQVFTPDNTEESFGSEDAIDTAEDDNHDGLGFDIF